MISAKAIGMPRAIAPSREKVKTAIVIAGHPASTNAATADRC
jgi:hypothetical protein